MFPSLSFLPCFSTSSRGLISQYLFISVNSSRWVGRKVTREVREQRAREAGFKPDKSALSKERVIKELDPSTAPGYQHMWEVWEE